VLLTQTPYGKDTTGAVAGGATGEDTYLIERGYIDVVADVRGTGDSGGQFGFFDPAQQQDGATLVRWAAQLPHSDGKVGLYGASYLGINQLLTVGQLGPGSPVKAIFPIVSANDLYRDTTFDGDQAFDGTYWQTRSPISALEQVVRDGVPAYDVAGWYDLFQRGDPLNFSGLQNALAGRSIYAPMTSSQTPSGRYQLLMGPWYHLTGASQDFDPTMLAWFDRWLKNEPTGSDQVLWLGANASCSRELDQWSMGAFEYVTDPSNPNGDPCADNDAATETGPGALTYTTAPFSQATVLGGPVDATIYATSTTPDTELVATLEDVAPDGTATPITTGALLGSMRALDESRSWSTPDGKLLLPYHPYTAQSKQAVPTGAVTRFDIEIRPTLAQIAAGDRLRLTLTTSDLPALIPTLTDAANLAGDVYEVQRNSAAASYLEILSAPSADVTP
jgi:uncharacterized protein